MEVSKQLNTLLALLHEEEAGWAAAPISML
jgi:hypothetical protein